MNLFKKVIKGLFFVIAALFLGGIVFIYSSPQFGGSASGDKLERIKKSKNYKNGHFVNLVKTELAFGASKFWEVIHEYAERKNTVPEKILPTRFDYTLKPKKDSLLHVTWYGHSAFLIEIEGKRVLIDPMLGPSASPISIFAQRFPYEQAIDLSTIKDIDLLIISHDHYDHLDYYSIKRIKDEVKHFVTPLGVGAHLEAWDIDPMQITELDWWEEEIYAGLQLTATPARHFSGRGLNDRNTTLWASWVIKSNKYNIYFSGDGGYASHFKRIGEKYGPFDFAMMECGQYNEKWEDIHMMPEQTALAGRDVKASLIMPIHWGAFELSMHSWTDPITRVKMKAEEINLPIIHPYIGERFTIGKDFPDDKWWEM